MRSAIVLDVPLPGGVSTKVRNSAGRADVAITGEVRTSMRFLFPVLLACVVVVASPSGVLAQGAAPHTVILADGTKKTGEISAELATGIKIKVAGKEETIDRAKVARVEYRDLPGGIGTGDRMLGTNPVKAAEAYGQAGKAGNTPALHKPRAFYGQGRALVRAGRFAQAAAAFKDCLDADPKGWFLADATREGVRAWIRAGEPKKGVEMATAAAALCSPAGIATDTADLVKAEALEADGKRKEAADVYVKLAASRDPQIQQRAELGRGRSDLADGNTSSAESKFKKLLGAKDVDRAVRAGAARGVADTLMKGANAKTNAAVLRQAATAYSEAASIHFPGPDDPTTDREGALTGLAECYEALAALASANKTGQERYLEMAKTIREEITTLYPPLAARGAASEGED